METKRLNRKQFYDALNNGEGYFYCEFEDAVVKIVLEGDKYVEYVKLRGMAEFKAKPKSGVVAQVWEHPMQISKEDYDKFI